MMLSAEKPLCRDTTFVDIDYEKLMVNKKTAIQRTSEITDHLENVEFFPDDKAVQIRSDHYLAIGCDLKNIEKLDKTLHNEVLPAKCSVLYLAEVSLTYMDVESANAVVNWASKLSSGQGFIPFSNILRKLANRGLKTPSSVSWSSSSPTDRSIPLHQR